MKCLHCGHDLSEHGSLGCMYEYEKAQSDGSLFCSCALTRNNAELTAAQAHITELETALQDLLRTADVYAEDDQYMMASAREKARNALRKETA